MNKSWYVGTNFSEDLGIWEQTMTRFLSIMTVQVLVRSKVGSDSASHDNG